MEYKEEYDLYMASIAAHEKEMQSENPRDVTGAIVQLEIIYARIANAVSDLQLEYDQAYKDIKEIAIMNGQKITDKSTEIEARLRIFEKHQVTLGHWKRLLDAYERLSNGLKKRAESLYNQINGGV